MFAKVSLGVCLVSGVICLLTLIALDGQAQKGSEVAMLRERWARNLLRNGDFEQGLEGWSTEHPWYIRGEGLSRWEVDESIAKSGKRSVKVIGKNNRGIAIQDVRPPVPICQVSGRLRCENLKGAARIFVEFIAADGKWLKGIVVGEVTGTTDWTFFSKEVEMPPDAEVLRVDLLTTEPNSGFAWFDDVSVVPVLPPSDGKPPNPLKFQVASVAGEEGALKVEWEPPTEKDIVAIQLFSEPKPFSKVDGLSPRAILRRNARSFVLRGLEVGRHYFIAIAALDIDGMVGSAKPKVSKAVDLRPPEPVFVDAEPIWGKPPKVRLRYQPHPVDDDIASFEILLRQGDEVQVVRKLKSKEREFVLTMKQPMETLSVIAVDKAGNPSSPQWQTIVAESAESLSAGFERGEGVSLQSRSGPVTLAPEAWHPTRLPTNLSELLSPKPLTKQGFVLSRLLVRPPQSRWEWLLLRTQTPQGTSLRVEVLDGKGDRLIAEATDGTDLSSLDSPILQLRATLIGDGTQTPELQGWGVTLQTDTKQNQVLDATTGSPVPDATVEIRTPSHFWKVHTDKEGRFTFPSGVEGLAQIRFTVQGYLDSTRWVWLSKKVTGCVTALYPQQAINLRAWFVSPLTHIFRDTEPQPVDSWQIHAARNETEGVQLALRAKSDLAWVRFLSGHNPQRFDVKVRFVGYVPLPANSRATPQIEELVRKAPGDFPDPLLDLPFAPLRSNETQPVFITVRPKQTTKPGDYKLPLIVETPVGELSVTLRVQVYPFVFPDRTRLWFTNWFNASNFARYHGVPEWGNEHFRWMRLYAKLMGEHRQNVLLVPLGLVQVFQISDGTFRFDFERFERFIAVFEKEGVAERLELSHIGGRKTGRWEDPEFVAGTFWATNELTGERVEVPLETFLQAVRDHLKATRRLKKAMLHIADEPIPVNAESWKVLSDRVHLAVPDLPRIDAIHVPNLEGHLEIWVPQLNYFAQWMETYRQRQREGNEIWFYTAWVPQGKWANRLIDFPLIKTRILHWFNVRYGATGFLHWGWNHWGDVMVGELQSPGDAFIVYPGPNASLRMEAQRDGIEDAELLWTLAERMAKGKPLTPEQAASLLEPLLKPVIRDFTDFTKDPYELEGVRQKALQRLSQTGR